MWQGHPSVSFAVLISKPSIQEDASCFGGEQQMFAVCHFTNVVRNGLAKTIHDTVNVVYANVSRHGSQYYKIRESLYNGTTATFCLLLYLKFVVQID